MIPTPDLSHLSRGDYDHVYEPAEDTFLLLDALEQDATELLRSRPLICLEIGSGSGCVSSFHSFSNYPPVYISTDINLHACRCTRRTGLQNKIPIDSILTSLTGALMHRLSHAVDVLLFNPPYVPTYSDEADDAQHDAGIAGAWAGGADGMQITNTVLQQVEPTADQSVQSLLSPTGRFYLVAVKENDVPGIRQRMLDEHRLQSQIVLQRRAGREHLFVVRFSRG
ncbi:hypothetical protein POSPLADRAFT_1128287 [Postia placenta MAD-698-R-SB12]|uniref:Methyltransferase small domain-containing protein n=1 Tax=Postia placenta MAD-698-R-SB12 TaxID=670580 RepID=A0A1X6NGT0_9APHY|nr:hypothetical protein POSPLADRAFT_1128287 [Postia placenta MAD-698-R-SB12]OSX67848.1 hypothetical protein POSPLADRAFT_1128287 [Postia placenta MAD-698-R-SB12]